MRAAQFSVVVATLGLLCSGGAVGAKPRPCQGRFAVGTPVLPGDPASALVVIDGKQVSIGDACAPARAQVAATKRGTRLLVKWRRCQGLSGKAQLKATIDAATCTVLAGTFRAP